MSRSTIRLGWGLAVPESRQAIVAPKGQPQKSPGQRPGENRLAARPSPCKGKTISRHPNDASVKLGSVRSPNSAAIPRLLPPFRARNYLTSALSPAHVPLG